jgi:TonB family protein
MNEPPALPDPPPTARTLWVVAAAIAVSLHLCVVALAYVHAQREPDDNDLGAPGIEIGLELASPTATPTDLPAGPNAEASLASPAAVEQATEVKSVDPPQETPIVTDTPDQFVTPEKREEPAEETPEVKVATQASEESIAQDATAAPLVPDVVETARSVTVEQGTAESRQRMRVTWQKELLAHLDKHKKYPATDVQKAARITLSLDLDRMGRVLAVAVIKSSGDAAFDEAARAMVSRANPVPPPPSFIADQGLHFELPVIFRVPGRR